MMIKSKFEACTPRVKSICFHPTLPWVLLGLHNGLICLYDYYSKQLIDKFAEHNGAVRGVCFHQTQPLFASGGDDTRIRLWNLTDRRCLYSFTQHSDFVRTVQFHHVFPWILSASDDTTMRIFNWQSRSCIAVILGHKGYVMTAFFHPQDDLIVSASLDNTVRVWDYSDLKRMYATSAHAGGAPPAMTSTCVAEKIVIEGHSKFVNWAAFHPHKQLIVSGSDDHTVRVWRYQDRQAWEVVCLNGHGDNVTSCMFHPKYDLLFSCSEDALFAVWDYSNKKSLGSVRKKGRFWVVAAHPSQNYLAIGFDGGFSVFKLESERPPFERIAPNILCKIFNHELQIHDLPAQKTTKVCSLPVESSELAMLSGYPTWFQHNPFDSSSKAFICNYRLNSGDRYRYEVYVFPNSMSATGNELRLKGSGVSVFVARDQVCTLRDGEVTLNCANSAL